MHVHIIKNTRFHFTGNVEPLPAGANEAKLPTEGCINPYPILNTKPLTIVLFRRHAMTQNTHFNFTDKAESLAAGANEGKLTTEGRIKRNPNHNTNSNLHLCTDTAESQPAGANEVRLQTEGGISLNSKTNLNTQLLNSNLNSCVVFYCKRAFCFGNVK